MKLSSRLATCLFSLLFFTFLAAVNANAQSYPPGDVPAEESGTDLVSSVQSLAATDPEIAELVERLDDLDFATASPEELAALVDELLDELRSAFPELEIEEASVLLVTVNPDGTLSQEVPAQILVKDPQTGEVALLTIGSGFAPGSRVTLTIESDPVDLGAVEATDGGKFMAIAKLPASLPTGNHTLKAAGTDPDGERRVLGQPVKIEAPEATSTAVDSSGSDDSRTELAGAADLSAPAKSQSGSWTLPVLLTLGVAAMAGMGAFLVRRKPATKS